MKKLVFASIVTSLMLTSAHALACGGADAQDAAITSSDVIAKVIDQANARLNTKLSVERIERTGNRILDVDGKQIAAVRCMANYIHVFMQSEDGVRCVTMVKADSSGKIENNDLSASCKTADGTKSEFLIN